MAFKLEAL